MRLGAETFGWSLLWGVNLLPRRDLIVRTQDLIGGLVGSLGKTGGGLIGLKSVLKNSSVL